MILYLLLLLTAVTSSATALVLKVPEVAELLRCSTDSVYKMIHDGTLDHRKVGRKIIVPRRAVLEFLGEHEDDPAGEDGAVVALHGRADQGAHYG